MAIDVTKDITLLLMHSKQQQIQQHNRQREPSGKWLLGACYVDIIHQYVIGTIYTINNGNTINYSRSLHAASSGIITKFIIIAIHLIVGTLFKYAI